MTRIIQVDENQHELSPHGTLLYPLEVNHDDLSTFQNGFVRCHWHEEVEFSIVRKGRARYSLPGGMVELQEGQGILINANIPHSSAPADGDTALLLTVIVHPALVYGLPGSEIDTQLLRPFLQSRHLAWMPLTQEEMDGLRQVDRLTREKPFAWQLKCKQLLCGVFVTLLCRRGQQSSGQTDFSSLSRLEDMLAFLHSRYDQPLDLTALSRQCCLSREGCCRFFKRMTGQTISQYLEAYRVGRAAALLQTEGMTVTDAALQCGFSNAGRFSAAFARRIHMTPKAYQQLQHCKPADRG